MFCVGVYEWKWVASHFYGRCFVGGSDMVFFRCVVVMSRFFCFRAWLVGLFCYVVYLICSDVLSTSVVSII